MRRRLVYLLAPFVFSAALQAAQTGPLRSLDVRNARPAEVARDVRTSAPDALFRITGLQSADGETLTLDLQPAPLFTADFHLYVDGRDRGRDAVAGITLLRGTVEEWPGSSAVLIIHGATGAWSGYLAAGDRFYEVTLPAGVTHGSMPMRWPCAQPPSNPCRGAACRTDSSRPFLWTRR